MTNKRAVVYPVVLSLMAALFPGFFSACTSNSSGLGKTLKDAQAPDGTIRMDATAGTAATGGAHGTGGMIASGGSASGGLPATGGIATGGIRATGGTVTGGHIGTGGIANGGIVNTGGAGGAGGVATGGTRVDAGRDLALPVPDSREAGTATCTQLATQEACEIRSDCHAVFEDQQNCGCLALGCCMRFSRCVTGAQAQCTGEALCDMATPKCEGPYALAYSGLCYEGCVRQTVCAANDAGAPRVDAPLPVDTATDSPPLSTCSNPMACKSGEIPIRIDSRPTNQCGCEPNPCGSKFPSCACAGDLCAKYNATCWGYAPGSGYLDCTPN